MNIFRRILGFYVDGFREMRVGRQLWALIIVKLIVFFAILKFFFFPDVLGEKTAPGDTKAETAATEILNRQIP